MPRVTILLGVERLLQDFIHSWVSGRSETSPGISWMSGKNPGPCYPSRGPTCLSFHEGVSLFLIETINQFLKNSPARKAKFWVECMPGSLIQCQKRSSVSFIALEKHLFVFIFIFLLQNAADISFLICFARRFSLFGTKEWVKPSVVCSLSLEGSPNKVKLGICLNKRKTCEKWLLSVLWIES